MAKVIRYALQPPFTSSILRDSSSGAELHFFSQADVAEFIRLRKHSIQNLEQFNVLQLEYEEPAVTVVSALKPNDVTVKFHVEA